MGKKTSWPKIQWREKGPRVAAGGYEKLGFGWELHYYDFLHRWNGGVPNPNCFKVRNWNGEHVVARVEYFHGIYDKDADHRDLRHAVYHTRDDLPRGALPIASINIEEDDWDLCTLLTFTWTDRINKIYLLANLHDCGPYDPDDLSRLQLVATSLPSFLKQLAPIEHFKNRNWFQLSVPPSELGGIVEFLVQNGIEDFIDEVSDFDRTRHAQAFLDDPGFSMWLSAPTSKLDGIKAPKKVDKDSSILAIDAYRWHQPEALKQVRELLKPIKLDRKIKKLGESAVE